MTFIPYKITANDWINLAYILNVKTIGPDNFTVLFVGGLTYTNVTLARVQEMKSLLVSFNPQIANIGF